MLERAVEEGMLREQKLMDEAQGRLARMQAVRAGEATMQEAMARRNIRGLQQTLEMEQVCMQDYWCKGCRYVFSFTVINCQWNVLHVWSSRKQL